MDNQIENTQANPNMGNQNFSQQQAVPNATAVLVLGILSLVTCWCYGIPGLIMAIIALALAPSGIRQYNQSPELYTESSFKNLKAGRICAIISLSLIGLAILVYALIFAFVGTAFLSAFPWENM